MKPRKYRSFELNTMLLTSLLKSPDRELRGGIVTVPVFQELSVPLLPTQPVQPDRNLPVFRPQVGSLSDLLPDRDDGHMNLKYVSGKLHRDYSMPHTNFHPSLPPPGRAPAASVSLIEDQLPQVRRAVMPSHRHLLDIRHVRMPSRRHSVIWLSGWIWLMCALPSCRHVVIASSAYYYASLAPYGAAFCFRRQLRAAQHLRDHSGN